MEGDSKSTPVPLLVKSELSEDEERGGKENSQPLKKLKSQHDNEQDNDEESLGTGTEDEEDEEEDDEEKEEDTIGHITLPAHDVIELSFDGIGAVPTYTHQIFDNEQLIITTQNETHTYTRESLADFMIKVDISLENDITDVVSITCNSGATIMEDTKQYILSNLSKCLNGNGNSNGNGSISDCPLSTTTPTEFTSMDSNSNSNMNINGNSSSNSNIVFPVGKKTYSFNVNNDNFEIYLATHNDVNASNIIRKCEKLAIWFIETADSVDFNDDRWEALFLFKKNEVSSSSSLSDSNSTSSTNRSTYTLAGYLTLYTFTNPFVGSKLRVCQALIMPSMQRGGYGSKLLHEVYTLAAAREVVVEVTVEDPAPGFSNMRDLSDIAWLLSYDDNNNDDGGGGDCDDGGIASIINWFDNEMSTEPIDRTHPTHYPKEKVNVEKISMALKLTRSQTNFVVEALQYACICKSINTNEIFDECHESIDLSKSADMRKQSMKSFRLGVKRRIMNENKQINKEEKTAMQKMLKEMYEEQLQRYQAVNFCKIISMREYINLRRNTPVFVSGA